MMVSLVRVAFDACLWTRRSGRLIGRSSDPYFAYYVSVQADCSCGRYFGPIRLGGPLSLYDGAMQVLRNRRLYPPRNHHVTTM